MQLNVARRWGLRGVLMGLALALPAAAWALGLGPIQTDTRIGQPFSARIPIVGASANDLQGLTVGLASPDAYKQAGLSEPDFLFDLKFSVESGPNGPYVLVSSSKSARLPFLNLLVHANWSSGEVTRQYTVLLNPPVFASGSQSAGVEAPAAQQSARSAPPAQTYSAPANAQPAAQPSPGGQPGSYGPVPHGDTLWGIAHRLRPNASVTINQMMMALYRANPDAFRGNINRLKAGYILRVPSQSEIEQVSPGEATRSVASQNAAWRGASSTPTAIANAAPSQQPPAGGAAGPGGGTNVSGAGAATQEGNAAGAGQGHVVLTTPEVTSISSVAAAGAASAAGAGSAGGTGIAAAGTAAQGVASNAAQAASTAGPVKVGSELAGILGTRGQAAAGRAGGGGGQSAGKPNVPNPVNNVSNAPGPAEGEGGGAFMDWMTRPKGWIVAGLVLLALAALLVVVLRRRGGTDDTRPAVAGAGGDSGGAAHRVEPDYAAPAEWREAPQVAAEGNALQRAMQHADYGEYDEAASILRAAIGDEPDRRDLRMKLLEVLFVSGESEGFREQAADLLGSGLVEKGDEDWDKVAGMGRQLLPEDPFFAPGRSPFEDVRTSDGETRDEEEPEHAQRDVSPLDLDVALDHSEEQDQGQGEPLEFERIVDELSTFIETYIPGAGEKPVEIDAPPERRDETAGEEQAGEEDLHIELDEIPSPEEANAAPEEDEAASAVKTPASGDGEAGAEVDPVDTKLDLARAYVDLGDPESARAMLEEVVDEGDEAQQEEARRLLDSLG